MLSHCYLRPSKSKIPAPCQPSLLPTLLSQEAVTVSCELVLGGMRRSVWVCMLLCTCGGQRTDSGVGPQVLSAFFVVLF